MLGIATVGEAAELRDHQIVAPILLLGPCDVSEVRGGAGVGDRDHGGRSQRCSMRLTRQPPR